MTPESSFSGIWNIAERKKDIKEDMEAEEKNTG